MQLQPRNNRPSRGLVDGSGQWVAKKVLDAVTGARSRCGGTRPVEQRMGIVGEGGTEKNWMSRLGKSERLDGKQQASNEASDGGSATSEMGVSHGGGVGW